MSYIDEINEIMKLTGLKELINQSSLTEKQFRILLLWVKMNEYDIKKDNKIYVNHDVKISLGTFYRMLSQARRNIKKSIVTMILLIISDLISQEHLNMIYNIAEKIKSEDILSDDEIISQIISEIKV
jgi:hypothetical protein